MDQSAIRNEKIKEAVDKLINEFIEDDDEEFLSLEKLFYYSLTR